MSDKVVHLCSSCVAGLDADVEQLTIGWLHATVFECDVCRATTVNHGAHYWLSQVEPHLCGQCKTGEHQCCHECG